MTQFIPRHFLLNFITHKAYHKFVSRQSKVMIRLREKHIFRDMLRMEKKVQSRLQTTTFSYTSIKKGGLN